MLNELRLRALLASLRAHVDVWVIEGPTELLDADNCDEAFRSLCNNLDRFGVELFPGEVAELELLGRELGVVHHSPSDAREPHMTALVAASPPRPAAQGVGYASESAWEYFDRATERSGAVKDWELMVGRKSARTKIAQALADADRAVELGPTTADFHVLRGEILARVADHQAARVALGTALRLDPFNDRALAALSEINIREIRLMDAEADVAAGLAMNPQSQQLQKRSHQFLRLNLFLPLWVATLTPAIAVLLELWIGRRNWFTAAVVLVGTFASAGFVRWWWRRRLSPSDRNRFVSGDGRRALVISAVLWVLFTLGGLVLLVATPNGELWNPPRPRSPGAEAPPVGGADLVGLFTMALAGAGVMVVAVMWAYSKAMGSTFGFISRRRSQIGDRPPTGPEQILADGDPLDADRTSRQFDRPRGGLIGREIGPYKTGPNKADRGKAARTVPPVELSTDGVVVLEPPSEIVLRLGESTLRFDAADTCSYPWLLVAERAGLVIILGWEATAVILADPLGQRVDVAGYLNRLDLSDGYDPGGMLQPAFHEIPGSTDILIEYEVGVARLDLVERRLTWQASHRDFTDRVERIADGEVSISGADGHYRRRLSDGTLVWTP